MTIRLANLNNKVKGKIGGNRGCSILHRPYPLLIAFGLQLKKFGVASLYF